MIPRTRKPAAPKAPAIDAPVVNDAGDPTCDRAPLGAHVSIAGGTWEAAARAREISATGAQLFTKQANRWAEREIPEEEAERFRHAMSATSVRWMCAHDSYLINLASPDPALRAQSLASFRAELRRCHALELDALVSHPGNFMDVRAEGLARNADAIAEALDAEPGRTRLLMELTAGQGTVLGSTFEEMAELLDRLPASVRSRVGVCLDTAHVWAAGYDLVADYEGVWSAFDRTLGRTTLGCLHLNDSKAARGSHLDRHQLIGEGTIGAEVFRRIMTDPTLADVPKILETPKGDDPAVADSRMLRLLRGFATSATQMVLMAVTGMAALVGAITTPLHAQDTPAPWRPMQEVAAWMAGTWLSGARIPTVSSPIGGAVGIGIERGWRPDATAGFMLRGAVQPLTLREAGDSWRGGILREANVLGMLRTEALHVGRWNVDVDALGGLAILTGAAEILPFRDAGLVQPTGEFGLSARRRAMAGPDSRHVALFTRVGVVRLGATAANSLTTSGWVRRVAVGLRWVH